MIWNKELTIAPSGAKTIQTHRPDAVRVFSHHPCTVADDSQNATVKGGEPFLSTSQALTMSSTNVMMPIGIFDWTSGTRLPIVIWCKATMEFEGVTVVI